MPDQRSPDETVPATAADAPATPRTAPPAARPGSLPFTPYGGTTAPYRPKAESAPRPPKQVTCTVCKAGFATRAQLDAHTTTAHPA